MSLGCGRKQEYLETTSAEEDGWMDLWIFGWIDRLFFFMLRLKGNTGGLTHQQPSL